MKSKEIIHTLFKKYEIGEELPPEVKKAVAEAKKKTLIHIAKKYGHFSLFAAATLSLFLWVKRYGISLSMAKSAVAVTVAAAIGTGGVAISAAITIKKIKDSFSEPIKIEKKSETEKNEKKVVQKGKQPVLTYYIAVNKIVMPDASPETVNQLTGEVISELKSIKGDQGAIHLSSLDTFHLSDKLFSISVIKLDDPKKKGTTADQKTAYRISAKVVNNQNSEVLMHNSETVEGEQEILPALKKLSKKATALR